MKDLAIFHTIR
jgi:hypothetical protein